MAKDPNNIKIVGLLVEVAKLDTVYRDIHLRRARELLSSTLDEAPIALSDLSERD